ncbi:lipopolysaccharide heptosyltransferase I [Planctomycetaceae bacterium SCGC AG-212-F19]|nr:lipopolysaccharide heptosyltransferase I [Planctomycetaceae bacterium SCGC AG-212-F19]
MPVPKLVPLHEYHARRIVIIKPSALGDIIHALPVLAALRGRFPDAYIAWVVNRTYEGLLEGHPYLNAVLPFDRGLAKRELLQAALGYGQFFRLLRREKFDLAIDLQGLFRSGMMMHATGAPRRVGLQSGREGARWFYTDIIPGTELGNLHAVDRYWLVAQALGAGNPAKRFSIPISDAAHAWSAELLQEQPQPWVMVGVGARWVTKRWPTEHFATLLRKTQDRFGGTAIFVGGPDETDAARQVARRLRGHTLDLTGRTSLPKLAALLARADVMLANDTGPLHLAAALGRPVVAPYTCTKIRLTGPYGAESGAVASRIWCQGSLLKVCDRMECMTELTPFRIWPVLHGILQQWETNMASA